MTIAGIFFPPLLPFGLALSAGGGFGGAFFAGKGEVFSNGRLVPFAKGGFPDIVDSPLLFPLRGATGVAGEAGPEVAFAPLRRLPNGEMGVGMMDERSGRRGESVTIDARSTVNVYANNPNEFRETEEHMAAAERRRARKLAGRVSRR